MNFLSRGLAVAFFAFSLVAAKHISVAQAQPETKVTLLKTPNGGIQPQAAQGSKDVLHLIYFKGEAKAGDVFYVRSENSGARWSTPLRVNSQAGSAIAMGTIRGAQISIGRNERVHVAWNGSDSAQPKGVGGNPMLYARLNDEGTAFENQRNLVTWAGGLDGGGTVAADSKGDVFVAWHAAPEGKDDAERTVYLARSTNEGRTFEREKKINTEPTGACGCCQMRAFVNEKGALAILYRAAAENINRDSTLLISRDAGENFQSAIVGKWKINACPMSSYALCGYSGGVQAAWENDGQIYTAAIDGATAKFSSPIIAPGKGDNRKHPVAIHNASGEMLLAWTEGTGWARGGKVAWQLFDKTGKPTPEKGCEDGVPVWGLLTAVARPDGNFLLIY